MSASALKNVHIKYYAILREQRGASSDVVETSARTAAELYGEMKERYGFSLPHDRMSVAINDHFVSWNDEINNKDVIVFVPPVAGG